MNKNNKSIKRSFYFCNVTLLKPMTELAVGFTTTVYENVFSVSKVFLGIARDVGQTVALLDYLFAVPQSVRKKRAI
jgi:hypothetical protein